MTETDNNESETTIEVDPIEVIHTGHCESLSGRSDLTFAIGRHTEDGTLQIAITGNSGGGMFSSEFVSATAIQDVVLGAQEIVGQSFAVLYPQVSTNCNAFLLAILREIGLVEVNPSQKRQHRHVSGRTLEKCVASYMARAKPEKPVTVDAGGRKTLKLKSKEG
jgi:hypothetical protein